MACLPVRGDNPRDSDWFVLRTGGQTWYNFYTTYISAHHEIFVAKICKGGIKCLALHTQCYIFRNTPSGLALYMSIGKILNAKIYESVFIVG